jgi:hypothetical protein
MSVAAAVRESGGSGARAWRRKCMASTGAAGRPLLLIARLITIIGRLGGLIGLCLLIEVLGPIMMTNRD